MSTEAERAAIMVLSGLAALAASAAPADDTTEVGAVEGDLPIWRAREAVRHAELRLGVQAQAMQALEARATSMLGWCVTGGLALGAAAANGSHVRAALVAAAYLLLAALLCLWGIVNRDWSGPGYRPDILLQDSSKSEYVALVDLAKGYQQAVDQNHDNFEQFTKKLNGAIGLMLMAPVLGAVALFTSTGFPLPLYVAPLALPLAAIGAFG